MSCSRLQVQRCVHRVKGSVSRLIVQGKVQRGDCGVETLRLIFLLTIMISVLGAYLETVEPFTVGIPELRASNASMFSDMPPMTFPDPGSWGCDRKLDFQAAGPLLQFGVASELLFCVVFVIELLLRLWSSTLEVRDSKRTPRLKRAHVQAISIRRCVTCVQARWWCSSLLIRTIGGAGVYAAAWLCLPYTLSSLPGMDKQAKNVRSAADRLRLLLRHRHNAGMANFANSTPNAATPGQGVAAKHRSRSQALPASSTDSSNGGFAAATAAKTARSSGGSPHDAAVGPTGASVASPGMLHTVTGTSVMSPLLLSDSGSARETGGTPACPKVTIAQGQLLLAVHAHIHGKVLSLQAAGRYRPPPKAMWPQLRPCCVCCCGSVSVPDEGTAHAFLAPHIVHGRANIWRPGSDVLSLNSARKERERAIAEGRIDVSSSLPQPPPTHPSAATPMDAISPLFGDGIGRSDASIGSRRQSLASKRGSIVSGVHGPQGDDWASPIASSDRRSSETSAQGFKSALLQFAAASVPTKRVVSATALKRSRLSAGVLQFGEVFGDDAVATMMFASSGGVDDGWAVQHQLGNSTQQQQHQQQQQQEYNTTHSQAGTDASRHSASGAYSSRTSNPAFGLSKPARRNTVSSPRSSTATRQDVASAIHTTSSRTAGHEAPADQHEPLTRSRSSSDSMLHAKPADGSNSPESAMAGPGRRGGRGNSQRGSMARGDGPTPMSPIPEASRGAETSDGGAGSSRGLSVTDRSQQGNSHSHQTGDFANTAKGGGLSMPEMGHGVKGGVEVVSRLQEAPMDSVRNPLGEPAHEQAYCTLCLPRWCCAALCRMVWCGSGLRGGGRGDGVQTSKSHTAHFSPVNALIIAGSEAAVSWTLFSDRPTLRIAVPIVGNEPPPLPMQLAFLQSVAGSQIHGSGTHGAGSAHLGHSASQFDDETQVPADMSPLRLLRGMRPGSQGVAASAGAARRSIGATAQLASSNMRVPMHRPPPMPAHGDRPDGKQAPSVSRTRGRLASLGPLMDRDSLGRVGHGRRASDTARTRDLSGSQGLTQRPRLGSGWTDDSDPDSRNKRADEAHVEDDGGQTVMALGRTFALRPGGASGSNSMPGRQLHYQMQPAVGTGGQSMYSVDILPEFLDGQPLQSGWSRVWALTNASTLMDVMFLLPLLVWVLSGFSTSIIGPCVTGLNVWRVLRAARVVKILRYYGGFRLLAEAVNRKLDALFTSWLLCACGAVLVAGLIFVAEYDEKDLSPFNEMGSALWWSFITLTTVGYGDKFPLRPEGKLIATITAMMGIALFTLPSSALAAGFSEHLHERAQAKTDAARKLREIMRRRKLRRPFAIMTEHWREEQSRRLAMSEGSFVRDQKRKAAVRRLFRFCADEQAEVFMAIAQAKKVEKRLRMVAQSRLLNRALGSATLAVVGTPIPGIPALGASRASSASAGSGAGSLDAATWGGDHTLNTLRKFLANPSQVLARSRAVADQQTFSPDRSLAPSIGSVGYSGGASSPPRRTRFDSADSANAMGAPPAPLRRPQFAGTPPQGQKPVQGGGSAFFPEVASHLAGMVPTEVGLAASKSFSGMTPPRSTAAATAAGPAKMTGTPPAPPNRRQRPPPGPAPVAKHSSLPPLPASSSDRPQRIRQLGSLSESLAKTALADQRRQSRKFGPPVKAREAEDAARVDDSGPARADSDAWTEAPINRLDSDVWTVAPLDGDQDDDVDDDCASSQWGSSSHGDASDHEEAMVVESDGHLELGAGGGPGRTTE